MSVSVDTPGKGFRRDPYMKGYRALHKVCLTTAHVMFHPLDATTPSSLPSQRAQTKVWVL